MLHVDSVREALTRILRFRQVRQPFDLPGTPTMSHLCGSALVTIVF